MLVGLIFNNWIVICLVIVLFVFLGENLVVLFDLCCVWLFFLICFCFEIHGFVIYAEYEHELIISFIIFVLLPLSLTLLNFNCHAWYCSVEY